ncbi:hypothetical protein AQUCO_00500021v1 [Aquilegia coerulea]|uniref:tetraacyldisaccharide 4'-kinase n=1 Tax=Aquilegia coerulea TaxID=218851 RepID=A0A2G5EQ10_AQUCA|nr:hypothetical protein AQUCO_00500021v1 [Aquilegia coerulea]
MEQMKRSVNQIAYTPTQNLSKLPLLQRSLIPFLFTASSIYKLALSLRHQFYHLGFFRKHRLPVPVISVGNLTWGGNGKTPMVEFLALLFAKAGISPLLLTRGYAGGDEAKMLQRHLSDTSAKIGVGANRSATAARFLEQHGYLDLQSNARNEKLHTNQEVGVSSNLEKIGVVILDDGMQHWRLSRDVEIVMVNGMKPWGNNRLIPLGPLREPLTSLKRADAVVIHHADLVSDRDLKLLELMIWEMKNDLPVFFTSLSPLCFFEANSRMSKMPLSVVHNRVVLCVSAIGSPDAFVHGIEKLGPSHVDRLDFSDHYSIQAKDVEMIKERLRKLHDGFGVSPVVMVTEKDYDRDPVILKDLCPFEVLVLSSDLQFMPSKALTGECFQKLLKQLLKVNFL